jgi:hypothetical protein
VIVVVAEHSEHRDRQIPTRVGEHVCLLGLSCRREIAGKHDHVRFALDLPERAQHALARRFGRVDVPGSSDPDHPFDVAHPDKTETAAYMPESSFGELVDAMKAAAGILMEQEIPFVLGGGMSAWARGGPKSEHDVDFLLRPEDAEVALEAFAAAGWRTERPPEGWLYKTWHENGALVDLIFSPASGPITAEMIEHAPMSEVMALRIRVSTLEDVLTSKLMAMTEQEPDFGSVLEWARALREQIDWDVVRTRTEASPFAKAFFTLVEELGVVDASS